MAEGAQLGEGVTIGPCAVIGPRVRLADGCRVHSHVVIEGETSIGENTEIYPFAALGVRPQDKKLKHDASWTDEDGQWLGKLVIGAENEIREHVTIHGGTPHGSGQTTVGDGNMFLAGSHLGHDAVVGNSVVFTNGAMAAGHTRIEDNVVLGAMVGIHQFGRVGTGAMIGAGAMLSHDAPPYALAQGDRARLIGVNIVGLRRLGFSQEQAARIKKVYRLLFWRDGVLEERLANARAFADGDAEAMRIIDFVAESVRGVCTPRGRSTPHSSSGEL